MASFFGNVMVTPDSTLSSYSASSTSTTTTTLTVQKGNGTNTYLWAFTGTTCTISNGTTVTPTFNYSAAGTTNAYCTVTNADTGISVTSPLFVITWSSPTIPITAMSFTLNGTVFTTTQNRASGTSYTIAVGGTTPAAATYSPSSTTFSTDGSYSLTSSGTGSYTGTYTSATVRVTTATITQGSPTSGFSTPASVALSSGVTATAWAWSYVPAGSTATCTFAPSNAASTTITAPNTTPAGRKSNIQCIVTFSGGTATATGSITWGLV
jgi:hypothetical protein